MNSHQPLLRMWLIVLGMTTLFWSSKEDHDATTATLLGLAFAASAIISLAARRQTSPAKLAILCGASLGAGTSIATTALMLFKNSLHAHIFPDYPPELLLNTLTKLPAWALAGGLAGLGLSLLMKACAGTAPISDKTQRTD